METASELPRLGSGLLKRVTSRIVPADRGESLEILVNASKPWRWLKTSQTTTKRGP
jgi:hypothetical protein